MDWCCNHGSGRQDVEEHHTHCRPAGLCAVCLVLRLEDQTGETGKQLVGVSESSVGSSGCLSSQGPLAPLQWGHTGPPAFQGSLIRGPSILAKRHLHVHDSLRHTNVNADTE